MDLSGANEETLSNTADDREKVIDLPDGWQKRVVRRMTGRTGESGRFFDVYLKPPNKAKKLRSYVELMKYILANPKVPIDGRCVNMERTHEVYTSKMTSGTARLIEFIEKVKAGEHVDINDYQTKPRTSKNSAEPDSSPVPLAAAAAAPTASPSKRTPNKALPNKRQQPQQPFSKSLSPLDVQQLIQFQQQQLFQQRLQQQLRKQQQEEELQQRQQRQFLYQQQQLLQKIQQQQSQSLLRRQQQFLPEVSKKKPALTPFLYDYLTSTSDLLPDLTVSQAIELEKLIDKSPNVPTPDQISDWASNFGVKYTDMQEWIGMKYFAKWVSLDDDNDVEMDDDADDPLEGDDAIIPASLCNVVMED